MSTAQYEPVPENEQVTLYIKKGTTYLSSGLLIAETDRGPLQAQFSERFEEQTLVMLPLKSGATFFQLNVRVDANKDQKIAVLKGVLKERKLVLHPKGDEMVRFQQGLRLASLIPGARFVPLQGRNHIPFPQEPAWAEFVRETRAFLGTSAAEANDAAELFDPATGTWTDAGRLAEGRAFHTATRLPDGTVLVVGGLASGRRLANAERYDPTTGAWTAAGALSPGRFAHTATPLADGAILVVGGVGATERLADAALCRGG